MTASSLLEGRLRGLRIFILYTIAFLAFVAGRHVGDPQPGTVIPATLWKVGRMRRVTFLTCLI